MTIVFVFYFWLAWSLVIGVLANRYGQSEAFWIVMSLLFSPIVAGPMLLAIGPR